MRADYLRALQTEILSRDNCAALVCLDVPKWSKPPELMKDPETGLMVTINPGVPHPDWLPSAEVVQRDRTIAALLVAEGWGATSQPVESWRAKKLLIKRGKWMGIVRAAENADHQAQAAAFAAVELANDARMTADFCDADAAPLMAGLVAASLLSDADVAALRALCTAPSTVTADHVSRALRGPWGDEQ